MKRSYIVLFHIIFWLPKLLDYYPVVMLFWAKIGPAHLTVTYDSAGLDAYNLSVLSDIVTSVLSVVIFYFVYLYLFPKYVVNQKIWRLAGYGICAAVIITVVDKAAGKILAHYLTDVVDKFRYSLNIIPVLISFFRFLVYAITACMFKAFINWYNDIRYKKELENRNLQTELALLKAQINPHFLFNTLNNIDVLIEKDSATASVYLKKLSDLLRFTLYESPAETIPLAKEISGIEQYIDLQRIRTSNPDFVKFEVKGNTDGLFVAPMIFMPFVENAFKHSTNKKIDRGIDIVITIDSDMIGFSCANVFDDAQVLEQAGSGLGLELINSRLNLFYRDNHILNISKDNNLFSVNLSIRADDN